MNIAIQGFTGSYHAIAAEKVFNSGHTLVMCDSFVNLFKALDSNMADCAIMAIENTIAGTILFNYALLRNSNYEIAAETFLKIEHCLMALPNQTVQDIKEVRSHPMALMQCHRFFAQFPHIKLVEDIDTAYVAEKISNENIYGIAAIAGESAAQKFDLSILHKNIEDTDRNYTRFFVLTPKGKKAYILRENTLENKATLCFSLPHQRGALSKVLSLLAENKINVMALNSTPYVGNAWEYFFYIDVEFDNVAQLHQVLNSFDASTLQWQILGTYTKAIH